MEKDFGEFLLGANWWNYSTGPEMWVNFNTKEIEEDFRKMEELGLNTARIFLRWQDFQKEANNEVIIVKENVKKLDQVLKIAKQNKIKIILTLFVGWMSGVWYHPPFVAKQEDLFVNPKILKYQRLYVKYFAQRYKDEDIIVSWDLANEQDALYCPNREAAYLWMSYLTNELRINGVKQKITTGIHNMEVFSKTRAWFIKDSSEFSDFNVIHPYPCVKWYSEVSDEPLSIRSTLFPAFLARFYEGIGKRPVLMEEFGSLGESLMDSSTVTPIYLKRILFSIFSNGVKGALWWCFRDFKCITQSPYEFTLMENDGLGIFNKDGSPKKFAEEFKKFSNLLNKIKYSEIKFPDKKIAIVVPYNEKVRRKIFAAFILSKMAGFNPDIILPEDDFNKYKVLIIPSVEEFTPFRASCWERMKKFVKDGGILYLSYNGTSVTELKEVFGIKVLGRRVENKLIEKIIFNGNPIYINQRKKIWDINIETVDADVLGVSANENIITEHKYGKGYAIFCRYPIEEIFLEGESINSLLFKVYEYIKNKSGKENIITKSSPDIECNDLMINKSEVFVFINHGKKRGVVVFNKHLKLQDVETGEVLHNKSIIVKNVKILQKI